MVFLCEDDRVGHLPAADLLLRRARASGAVSARLWRGLEGFGATGHLRAARLPDLARGLPLLVEVVGDARAVAELVEAVAELAPGALVTLEAADPTPAANG